MEKVKRTFKRVRLVCSLEVIDSSTGNRAGMLSDINAGGMGIRSSNSTERGALLRVRLQLPCEIKGRTNVELHCECQWSGPADTPGLHKCGYRFIDVPPDAAEIIDELIMRYKR